MKPLDQLFKAQIAMRDALEAVENSNQNIIQEFHGQCFGARIVKEDSNPSLQCWLMVEDDGNWFLTGDSFAVDWLPDVIQQLQLAQKFMKAHPPR